MEFQVLCPAPDRSLTAPVPPGRLKARAFSFLIFSALALILAACSGTPKWVSKGGGYMSEKDNKAFYGVGAVTGIRNEPLAKETADNRARADLAKYVDTYTAYLMRDYAASTTAGDFTKSSEEQNVERAVKTFVSAHLSGVQVVDRWEKDEKSGKVTYALAKMDLASFKESVGQMKDLNEAARDFVRKNAERAFDRLQQEEDRRNAK
ncbi:MAG: hypothetical protein AUH96_01990 [Nitrospirae bacterium 13_2_20CM_2_61_4]|nr:MAG: hypothetical protein AUH96_01990 [Nitrospirae bacterium 13_2_20CM_2_61_4]